MGCQEEVGVGWREGAWDTVHLQVPVGQNGRNGWNIKIDTGNKRVTESPYLGFSYGTGHAQEVRDVQPWEMWVFL